MGYDLFYLKKVFERFLSVEWFAALILIVGVIWLVRNRSLGGIMLICVAGISLLVASLPLTGFLLTRILEMRAGPPPDHENLVRQGVRNIVVLQNMVEFAEFWKKLPGSRLIISASTCGTDLYDAARGSGMPEDLIVLETQARDTQEQSEYIKSFLHDQNFGLVTWAGHMPRAILIFKEAGLNPVPMPFDFVKPPQSWLASLLPSREGLELTKRAVHEYAGMLWITIKKLFK